MIVRVYRGQIRSDHQAEFERKFRQISMPLVQSQPGLISAVMGRPVSAASDEFVMISTWTDLDALRAFVGEDYTAALIPHGMEQHIAQSWVHHYEVIE